MTEPLPLLAQPDPPHRRRPSRNILIAGGAVAVAVIGGTVWAVVATQSTPSATADSGTPTIAATSPTATPSTPAKGKAAGNALRGDVTAESGSTWTVQTRAGKSLTVVISANTSFGTKKRPLTAAQVPAGTTVIITGSETNGALDATRVVTAATARPSASPTITS
jgi:hypothetical protein